MIRIDYDQIGHIKDHIIRGLQWCKPYSLYVSNTELYSWLLGAKVNLDLLN